MVTKEYRDNRSRFPRAELLQYQGQWVAFSADGGRVVASGATITLLEEQLAARGESAPPVVLEWIAAPEEDSLLGAGEWM